MDYCYVLMVDCEWFEFEHKPLDDEDGIYICWTKEEAYKKAKELFGEEYDDNYENRYFTIDKKMLLGRMIEVKQEK